MSDVKTDTDRAKILDEIKKKMKTNAIKEDLDFLDELPEAPRHAEVASV